MVMAQRFITDAANEDLRVQGNEELRMFWIFLAMVAAIVGVAIWSMSLDSPGKPHKHSNPMPVDAHASKLLVQLDVNVDETPGDEKNHSSRGEKSGIPTWTIT